MTTKKFAVWAALITLFLGQHHQLRAQSDSFEWTGMGSNTAWNNVDNWLNLTNGQPGFPVLGDNALFTFSDNVTGGAVSVLEISPGSVLTLGGGVSSSLSVDTTILNQGEIAFGADTSGNDVNGSPDQRILIVGNTQLGGGGTVSLSGGETGVAGTNVTFTNLDNTFQGRGTIAEIAGDFQFNNRGMIVPEFGELFVTNLTLDNSDGLIDITSSGTFRAPGSSVSGGVINGQGGNARFNTGDADDAIGTLSDVTLTGEILVGGPDTGFNINANTLGITGTITNNGEIGFQADTVGSDLTGPDQRMRVFVDFETDLEGGGVIQFNGAETGILGEGVLNNIDNEIRGPGTIQRTGTSFTFINTGTLLPESGNLTVVNTTLDNSDGLIDITSSGTFRAPGSSVSGGVINGQGGNARFNTGDADDAIGTLSDVTLTGEILVGGPDTGFNINANTLGITGTITNNGEIGFQADTVGSDLTGPDQRMRVFIDFETDLEGGGVIQFNGAETGILGEGVLNNIDNEIRGPGTIQRTGTSFTFNNTGTIVPDFGSFLVVNLTLDNSDGLIDITSSGTFRAPGSSVSGGVINGQGGNARFNTGDADDAIGTLSDVTLTGEILVGGPDTGFNINANTLGITGTITNNGEIGFQADTVGSDLTGPDQRILVNSNATMAGSGAITLNGNETGIVSTNNSTLINEGTTIQGNGIVSAIVDNRGTLFASSTAGDLIFQNNVVLRPSSVLAVGLNGFNFAQTRQLVFDLPLDINGTLKLVVGDNFDAAVGTTRTILTTPILGGPAAFPQVDTSMAQSLTRGFEFDVILNPSSVQIEVTNRYLRGDINQDGIVDLLDVAPFVNLVIEGTFQLEGDLNGDGAVDLLDVAPFVNLLTGG